MEPTGKATTPVTVTRETDLQSFVGVPVRITRTVQRRRWTYEGTFVSLHHSNTNFAGGMLDATHPVPGLTGFGLDYGDATLQPLD